MVATGSPGMITEPRVAGTVSTRPSAGAMTAPSVSCWVSTARLACVAAILVADHLDIGGQLRQPLPRHHALAHQRLAALEFGLRGRKLGAEGCELGVLRSDLKRDLVVP